MNMDFDSRRNVTAILGPTNTGKTHLAIERMVGHDTGMIGLPLRLLAREVYDKVCTRVGREKVALVTGEEKIKPDNPRYWVSTVEAMPRGVDVDFLAIDEIQLCSDPERGHVFTDRLLHARGRRETLLLGASTMREAVSDLVNGANFISRPRLSKLTYAGEKKLTRLPKRTAVVAFSAGDVYAIAELIRRQLGGAAVVLGALSPRTRNAQVALYQSGDVDYIVATDAIGMGLNLDVDHVAFAAVRKFDGQNFRNLTPGELAQIAGRAGRHMNDGTFGVTGDVPPFEQDVVERLETHTFETIRTLQWRSRDLDFASIDALRDSLRQVPREPRLVRARMADDVAALETVSADREVMDLARNREAVSLLWDVCQVPDYRKISSQNHAELVSTLFKFVAGDGRIPEDWFSKQVAFADRTDGDIDTLANRIAHIRTWTFVSNRPTWLADPEAWQERTRKIEDALSDALHERLTQRFVDKRTSALMKGLRDKDELAADIGEDGAILVENHFVGRLKGFRFTPDAQAEGIHGKATRQAAAQVVAKELSMRARRVAAAKPDAFKITRQARILWRDEEIGRLEPGEDPLKPQVILLADEHLSGPDRDKVQERLNTWIVELVADRLKPLAELAKAEDVAGLARGIAFRLTENFGVLKRETIGDELKSLDQNARAQLRKYGVRFGAFNIYFPILLKPAAAELRAVLWALKNAQASGLTLETLPDAPRAGLTSIPVTPGIPEPFYRVYGFHVCGPRVVRLDMLERLADIIRPLVAWRQNPENTGKPPRGATGDGGFLALPEMMSILGCSSEELGGVLKALGFWCERRPKKAEAAPPPADAPKTDDVVAGDETAAPLVGGEVIASDAAQADETSTAAPASEPVPATADTQEEAPAVTVASAELEAPNAEAPASEPTASEAPAAVAAADAASTEVAYEEVWRPRRRQKGGQRPERQQHRGPRRFEGQQDGRNRGQRHGQRGSGPRSDAPAASTAGGDPAAGPPADLTSGTAAPAGEQRPDERRRERGDRDRGDRRDRTERGDRPRRDNDRAAQGRDRRDDDRNRPGQGRGGDRRDRQDRPQIIARSGPAPKKGVDPDSPFAALGALKQALEKRARDQGGS